METKPFSLQAPEQIAKDYGGNKQKIASAAQMGMLDPTAAVMAGMFIDRMRSSAMMEQAPSTTVAQDVLAAPQQPQGLGGMPPQGMPPQGMPPQGMPPQGLEGMPVPDTMFAEGGYVNGGIVSFAKAGEVSAATPAQPSFNIEEIREYMTGLGALQGDMEGPAMREQAAELQRLRSPEYQKERKQQDLYGALAQIGFGMAASKSPNFLQAAGESASAALPGMQEATKARRAEQSQALKSAVDMELAKYGQKSKNIESAIAIKNAADNLTAQGLDRAQAMEIAAMRNEAENLDRKSREALGYAQIASSEETSARQLAAQSDTDQERGVQRYVRAALAGGDKRPRAIIENEGRKDYQSTNAGLRADTSASKTAMEYTNATLYDRTTKRGRDYMKLVDTNPAEARKIYETEYNKTMKLLTGGQNAGGAGAGKQGVVTVPWM